MTVPIQLRPPLFLGILNITPDSFSDGGRFLEPPAALAQARHPGGQGRRRPWTWAAESTRPGAAAGAPGQEWARLEPVLAPAEAPTCRGSP